MELFYGSGLTSIIIPSSIKTIESMVFSSCPNLTEVTILNGVETISTAAFDGNSLKIVRLPSSISTIGSGAFDNVNTLTIYVETEAVKNLVVGSGATKVNVVVDPSKF